MSKTKKSFIILSQSRETSHHQLSLPLSTPQKNQSDFLHSLHVKRQIESIPGISPKERNRYRVTLSGQILGDGLALDEALALAKEGGSAIAPSSSSKNTLL